MIKKVLAVFNLDGETRWVFTSKASLLMKGPVMIGLVALFLTQEQQGLWYVFISLSALTMLADFGFTLIISQYVSQESASYSLVKGLLPRKSAPASNTVSLIKYAIKFYSKAIPVVFFVTLIYGGYVLDGDFFTPWFAYALIASVSLMLSLFLSIYQGFDKVVEVNKAKSYGLWSFPIVASLLIIFGAGIWGLVFASLVQLLVTGFLHFKRTVDFWLDLYRYEGRLKGSWSKELLPLQGKYLVSWGSGFLIMHLFVPTVYKLEGAIVAGQIGMLLAVVKALVNISNSWLDAKIPKFNFFVARGDIKALDKLFKLCVLKGYVLFLVGACGFVYFIIELAKYSVLTGRFPELEVVLYFLFAELGYLHILFFAKYIRVHLDEGFYKVAFMNGLLVLMSLLFILPSYGLHGVAQSLVFINWVVVLPLGFFVMHKFLKERKVGANE